MHPQSQRGALAEPLHGHLVAPLRQQLHTDSLNVFGVEVARGLPLVASLKMQGQYDNGFNE